MQRCRSSVSAQAAPSWLQETGYARFVCRARGSWVTKPEGGFCRFSSFQRLVRLFTWLQSSELSVNDSSRNSSESESQQHLLRSVDQASETLQRQVMEPRSLTTSCCSRVTVSASSSSFVLSSSLYRVFGRPRHTASGSKSQHLHTLCAGTRSAPL